MRETDRNGGKARRVASAVRASGSRRDEVSFSKIDKISIENALSYGKY
jgi:ribosomal protein L18E